MPLKVIQDGVLKVILEVNDEYNHLFGCRYGNDDDEISDPGDVLLNDIM